MKLSLEEIKQYSLEILIDIHNVCSKLNLTYFLDSGTLLGAIRHNGFIPWDDDLDISMPRPDYEIFIQEYNNYCSSKFKIKSIEIDSEYGFPYAKIYNTETILYENGVNPFGLGLSVDVFAIDGYPDNIDEQQKHYNNVIQYFNKYARLESLAESKYSKKPNHFINNIKILFTRKFFRRRAAKKVIENSKKYPYERSNYAGLNVCIYYHPKNRWVPKECWKPISHIFEDNYYLIPEGYDSILKSYYGDNYLTPPPEDRRVSTHGLEVYRK